MKTSYGSLYKTPTKCFLLNSNQVLIDISPPSTQSVYGIMDIIIRLYQLAIL